MSNIATYNIARISSPEKLQILLNLFLDQKLDIICLQEVTFLSCHVFTNYQMYTNLGPKKHGTANFMISICTTYLSGITDQL